MCRLFFLVCLFFVCQVRAGENFGLYVNGFGGPNTLSLPEVDEMRFETEKGMAFGGAFGCALPWGIRLEAEGSYRNNPLVSVMEGEQVMPLAGDVRSIIVTLNGSVDFRLTPFLTCYAGGGEGYRKGWGEAPDFASLKSLEQSSRVWQAIFGVRMQCAQKMHLQFEYRLLESFTLDQIGEHEYKYDFLHPYLRQDFKFKPTKDNTVVVKVQCGF